MDLGFQQERGSMVEGRERESALSPLLLLAFPTLAPFQGKRVGESGRK